MRLVVDTNRIIASLIKNSYSRALLVNNQFKFYSPDYTLDEIETYKEEIMQKSELNEKEFTTLFEVLLEKIKIVQREEYALFIEKAEKIISDPKDVPFIALALAIEADAVWSDDKHFLAQKEVKTVSTKELLEQQNKPSD